MKMSLLDIVQDILSDMDSDEVNSINDTTESLQVAQVVRTCYFEMIGNRNWPHLKKLIQLDSPSDLTRPNYLKLPVNVKELVDARYLNDKGKYVSLKFRHPDEFLELLSHRTLTNTNVETVYDFGGSTLLIVNDKDPEYWTTFDDNYIVCDSYNSVVDDTLKASKTQCLAYIQPVWVKEDTFIPDLPVEAFPALLEEAKSTAFFNQKQMVNQKAEQKAGRQQRWLSRKAWRAQGGVKYPDYGRKR
jgi:hypothetical protein